MTLEEYDYDDYSDKAQYEEEGEDYDYYDYGDKDSVITSISSEFTVDLGDDLRLPCRVKKSVI